MILEAGERMVLNTIISLQESANQQVEDYRIASQAGMQLEDVRDWLESHRCRNFSHTVHRF